MERINQKRFSFLSNPYVPYTLVFISGFCALRALFLPLNADEITYFEIAKNLLENGDYYFQNQPSAISPLIPSIFYITYTDFNPMVGFAIARLFFIVLVILGVIFLYLTLKRIEVSKEVIIAVIALTVVNNNFIIWSTALYPESIIFCFLWIFIYGVTGNILQIKTWFYILIPLTILVFARYLFAVLGAVTLISFIQFFSAKIATRKEDIVKLTGLVLVAITPLVLWFMYVYNVIHYQKDTLSYFGRFKDVGILYNIKAGLGIIQHYEAGKINGIPAFASLFIPITGFRSWTISLAVLLAIFAGYINMWHKKNIKILVLIIILILLGYIYAGTGFSRYWLPLLPAFILGIYYILKMIKVRDRYFIIGANVLSILYVVNELRITNLILERL